MDMRDISTVPGHVLAHSESRLIFLEASKGSLDHRQTQSDTEALKADSPEKKINKNGERKVPR